MSLVGNGKLTEKELPVFGENESSHGDDRQDREESITQDSQYDVGNTTLIKGALPNDPRLMGPTQMETTEDGKLKRNSFACVSCHSLKQKCVPSDFNDIYRKPCKRCLKNGKLCEFDLSKRTRKRKRRSSTASPIPIMTGKSQPSPTLLETPIVQPTPLPGIQQSLPHIWSGINPPPVDNNSMDRFNASFITTNINPIPSTKISSGGINGGINNAPSRIGRLEDDGEKTKRISHLHHMKPIFKKQLHSLLMYQKGKVGEISSKLDSWAKQWNELVQNGGVVNTVSDPVSLGIIRMEEAEFRFELYKTEFSARCKLPFIKFSPYTTVSILRQQKPILFSVIMSVVSVIMTSENTTRETNMKLDSFVLNLVTDQIFKLNHKSIELIESLLTLCLWYNFPEWSNKTRFHIFNYMCVFLTRDLGPTSVNRAFGMFSEEDPSKRIPNFKSPLELYDNSARLTLVVYISSLNISIFLRQPIQARWSRLMEKACDDVLNNLSSQESLYNPDDDKTLVVFARLNYTLEKIHIYLHEMSEVREQFNEDAEINDKHFKHLIEKFQTQLNVIFVQLPKNRQRELSFFYSVEAYLYQYIIGNYIGNLPKKLSTEALPSEVSEAFQKCYNYCALALEEFLKMPPKLVASLPLFHMSRIIYTVGMLLFKLRYSVVTLPSFQHFGQLTQNSITLVNKVAEVLENCSKIYEFNNFLYKFQYVVALFAQTYANKVGEVTNLTTKKSSASSGIQRATQQRPGSLGPPKALSTNNSTQSHSAVNLPDLTNLPVPDEALEKRTRSGSMPPAVTTTEATSTFINPDIRPSPSGSSDTINEYLTDIDSLMWGFNVLNEEFWTDIFSNDM